MKPAVVQSLTVAPTTITVGQSVTGTVTLNGKAPAGGLQVALTHVGGTGPASVTVPAEQSSATFQMTPSQATGTTPAQIQAAAGGASVSSSYTVSQAAAAPLMMTTTAGTAEVCTDRVQLVSLTASPAQPTHGEQVTATATLKNLCSSIAATIPWTITLSRQSIGTGTERLAAGATVNVTASWTSAVGTHVLDAQLDPSNTLSEAQTARTNNVASPSITLNVAGSWNSWGEQAKNAFRGALSKWAADAQILDVVINGPIAAEGRLISGIDLQNEMKNVMSGVPTEVVSAFVGATASAHTQWSGSVKVPALPWYPAFATVAFSEAPPTPNVPSPFASLVQDPSGLLPTNLDRAIKTRLGSLAASTGADAAVQAYTAFVGACFTNWISRQQIMLVMGGGPVPTFAPPMVPLAPVVNGRGNQQKGAMAVGARECP